MRKVGGLSPARASIDPSDFTDLLPQVFILGRHKPGHYQFRLAGALLSELHGKTLRRADFLPLWAEAEQARLGSAIEASRRAAEPLVLNVEARTAEGATARLEILSAPLRADGLPPDRCLGLYQPLSPLAQLRDQPVTELSIVRLSLGGDDLAEPRIRLAAVDGRLIA